MTERPSRCAWTCAEADPAALSYFDLLVTVQSARSGFPGTKTFTAPEPTVNLASQFPGERLGSLKASDSPTFTV